MSGRKDKIGFSVKGSRRDIQLLLNDRDNIAMLEDGTFLLFEAKT